MHPREFSRISVIIIVILVAIPSGSSSDSTWKEAFNGPYDIIIMPVCICAHADMHTYFMGLIFANNRLTVIIGPMENFLLYGILYGGID